MNERDSQHPERHLPAVRQHSRHWRENLYVYPVISRRSRGLSVGVNLNPDMACNFGCVYCQVNRRVRPPATQVDLAALRAELHTMLGLAIGGELWKDGSLSRVPEDWRRINDIAFSGDGEPTCYRNFDQAVQLAIDAKTAHGLDAVKIVVISNATCFHTQAFQRAIPLLQAHGGEVWAKLDAGTAERFRRMNRSDVSFSRVLENIARLARTMPIVIQTMLLRLDGQGPGAAEIDAYVARLREILGAGGVIRQVQLYTVARPPAETGVSALPDEQLDAIAEQVRQQLSEAPVDVYYGANAADDGEQ